MTFKIVNKKKNFEIIPEHRQIDMQTFIYPHNQVKDAGNYALMNGEDTVTCLSFNYSRSQSEMKFYSIDELNNLIKAKDLKRFSVLDLKNKPLTKVLDEMSQGIRLWKLFIVLALLFLSGRSSAAEVAEELMLSLNYWLLG